MDHIDERLIQTVDRYIESLFAPAEPAMTACLDRIADMGMPAISVSPNEGKLLYLIAKLSGSKRVLEIGTLGGYSTLWLARALPPDGTVVTLEIDPRHAEVARENFQRCSIAGKIEIRLGDAAGLLRKMVENGEQPFDLVFIDADKTGYCKYLGLVLELSRPGTVILADNIIRNGAVTSESPSDANAKAARAYNAMIASHPRLESLMVPLFRNKLDGIGVSIVR